MWNDARLGLKTSITEVKPTEWMVIVPYAGVALGLGLGSGLLQPEIPSLFEVLLLPFLLVIYPSLIEEFIFRGLLLPHSLKSASAGRQFVAITISTGLFVLMHPLNAWLVGLSDTSQFLEPSFLFIVSALGYTCGYLYVRSGLLRAPILVHWATVVSWNLFLGRELAA